MFIGGTTKVMGDEKKDNSTDSRGDYSAVVDLSPLPKRHLSYTQAIIRLGPLVALPFLGVGLMLSHHFFYTYLNQKSIEPTTAELPPLLQNQNNANAIGTTIAHAARIVISMGISSVFVQLFWKTLGHRGHTIQQIDALINCGQSPFQQTLFRAARASFSLFTISVIASATAIVVVLTPGSLTVSPTIERRSLCAVPSIPQGAMEYNATDMPPFEMYAVMTDVLALNSYLPPFQTSPNDTCGYDTCSYNATFIGPALSCVDITNETNLSSFVNPDDTPHTGAAPFFIWNATMFGLEGTPFGVTILSRDLVRGILQAINCSVSSANFEVGVKLVQGEPTVRVWNTSSNATLVVDNSFISTYAQYGVIALTANLFAGPDGYTTDFTTFRTVSLQSNPFFVTTSTGNHTFSDSVSHFAETFIQNISLSFLSGNIYYGVSNDTATNLDRVNTICSSPVTGYIYDPSRLLSTYGVILGIGTVVIAFGCWLALRRGLKERLTFSDVILMALNEEMIRVKGKLAGKLRVQLEGAGPPPGRLVSLSRSEDVLRESRVETGSDAPQGIRRFLPGFTTTFPWKMALLILAALCCMAFNHLYYKYLDGRAPASSMKVSDWLRNQSVASDIGIAIAYACQTLLAITFATSCTQLFWRAIRSRGHYIHQIDALTEIQAVSFPRSMFRALRASWSVTLLALLVGSTSLVSIFVPRSIRISSNNIQSAECTVSTLRNLSALETTFTDYTSPITAMILSGTYLQPVFSCPYTQCSYNLQFVGPGFDCQDVTESSNFTAFNTSMGLDVSVLYRATVLNQTDDLEMQVLVQTWDTQRSAYRAVECTGVSRSYSVLVSSAADDVGNIFVTDSTILSTTHANTSQLSIFADAYSFNIMTLLADQAAYESEPGLVSFTLVVDPTKGGIDLPTTFPFSSGSSIGRFELDSSISFAQNLPVVLEELAQNVTLSLLSGTIFAFNSENPSVLENITATCSYQLTAYEYSSSVLFLTYGVAISVTVLSAIWGAIAVKRNGEESMNFSRIVQATLNDDMFNARDNLDKDSMIKANDTKEGSLMPLDLPLH